MFDKFYRENYEVFGNYKFEDLKTFWDITAVNIKNPFMV